MDDRTLRILFSNDATLENIDTKETAVVSGPSLLSIVVLSMEKDVKYLATQGCIAKTNLTVIYGHPGVAGIYKTTQLPQRISESGKQAFAFFSGLTEHGRIPELKSEYQNCTGSVDFFYIPIMLVPLKVLEKPLHANGLLVSKSKGNYFRIEPEYSPEHEATLNMPQLDAGIHQALNEIGAKNFTPVNLNVVCPQFLTNDQNCLFWTAYITREIIRNIYKNQDPNTTIAQITNLGKEELDRRIKQFKEEVWKSTLKFLSENKLVWKEYEKVKPQTAGVYWPLKYFRGLTRRQNLQRKRSATRRTKMSFKNPKAYVPWKTDKGVKTRRSSYTSRFHKKYPNAKSLDEIAKATGISKRILQDVYDRGMAAWRTGHRPGASQHAWGMARVHSFVLHGKTWRTADADLARKV